MVRSFLPKAALLLVLILLLAAPVAQAAEPGTQKRPVAGIPGLIVQAWDFLTRVWAENGCGLDPDGRCVPEPNAKAEAENGCRIDPDGRCAN
jgi:hypothetical protein